MLNPVSPEQVPAQVPVQALVQATVEVPAQALVQGPVSAVQVLQSLHEVLPLPEVPSP